MGKLIPQEISFPDLAPYQASASIVCQVPASAVFNVLKDHRKWPEWIGAGVTSVEPTSRQEYGIGSTRTVTFFGLAKVEERFIGWEEPTLFAFTGIGFRPQLFTKLVERFHIEPIDDKSCRIKYAMGGDFPLLLKPFAGLIIRFFSAQAQPAVKHIMQEAVRRYKG